MDILPGIMLEVESTVPEALYRQSNIDEKIKRKRLGSPLHFLYYFALNEHWLYHSTNRCALHFLYYFALNEPQGADYDRKYWEFLAEAQSSPEEAGEKFIALADIATPSGKNAAQVLLDHIEKRIHNISDPEIIRGILLAFSKSMDAVALKTGIGILRNAYEVFRMIYPNLQHVERQKILREIFKCEASVGWLSEIFRVNIPAHEEDNGSSHESQLLTQREIKIAADELWRHYRNLTSASLQKLPDIGALLAVWMLRGDQYKSKALDEEIREKIEALSQNDEDFLKILAGIKSWWYKWKPIHSRFMDLEKVKERLHALTFNADTDIAARAKELFGDLFSKDGKQ
jgi:hypothetical protein